MDFESGEAIAAVAQFCRQRRLIDGTFFTVAERLDDALWKLFVKGPDERWKTINARPDPADFPELDGDHAFAAERAIHDSLLRREHTRWPQSRGNARPWFLSPVVVSAAHWARFSTLLRRAYEAGVGWLIPANKEVLIVPRPTLRFAEGRPGVLHDDTGRMAVEWPDGSGLYFLQGTEFDRDLLLRVVGSRLTLHEIAALPNADQRSIALTYLTFQQLVMESRAQLLDTGVKGTALYRLPLPWRILRDRPSGYGGYDYFIHMHDASHLEREFVEWVDPTVGNRHDAELCQAHAFGITRDEWLSIDQEG